MDCMDEGYYEYNIPRTIQITKVPVLNDTVSAAAWLPAIWMLPVPLRLES